MSKPYIHALSSVRRWGGTTEDYLPIHDFMDSSKGAIPSHVHRCLTHTSWFISVVIERVFGHNITVLHNGRERKVSTRDIAEQHVLEDYGGRFIPTPQDFLQYIPIQPWMLNGRGGFPPSYEHAKPKKEEKELQFEHD